MIDEWVYTEHRKPESLTIVLLCVIHHPITDTDFLGECPIRTIGYYDENHNDYISENGDTYPPDDVICWRSVPDIPMSVMKKYYDT